MTDQKEYQYEALEESTPNETGNRIELAGRGRRLAASIIDSLISIAITFPMTFLVTGEWIRKSVPGDSTNAGSVILSSSALNPAYIGLTLGILAIYMAVQSWFIFARSQTIGKMALGIVININDRDERAGFGRIFLKRMLLMNFIGYIPVLGTIFSLVDTLFIFSSTRRCLHDRIANTWVVKA